MEPVSASLWPSPSARGFPFAPTAPPLVSPPTLCTHSPSLGPDGFPGGDRDLHQAHPLLHLDTSAVATFGNSFMLLVSQNNLFCGILEVAKGGFFGGEVAHAAHHGACFDGLQHSGPVLVSMLSHGRLLGSSGITPGSSPGAQCLLLQQGQDLERWQWGLLPTSTSSTSLQQVHSKGGCWSPRASPWVPAGSQLAASSQEQPKKGSKQTEILCTVECLHFLPRSAGCASLPSPLLS